MNQPQVADPAFTGTAEIYDHLERMLTSESFRKAPSLRHLLKHLVNKTLDGEQDHIKETTVAMEVFSRGGDFDSRVDNIVRVHAHRLRKLLEIYYAREGLSEKIRISIPKGGYIAHVYLAATSGVISPVSMDLEDESALAGSELIGDVRPPPRYATFSERIVAIAPQISAFILGALALFLILLWSGQISRVPRRASAQGESLQAAPLAAIWKSILRPGTACIISFTNPVFLWTDSGRSRLYMTYRGPVSVPLGTRMEFNRDDPFIDSETVKRAGPFFFSDSWTGTGEVAAVHKLTRLFSEADFPLKVLRSRVLSYSDMKGANVIFLGSPWANDMQEKLNIGATPLICRNNEAILNLSPNPGEPSSFRSVLTPQTGELVASYGLFSVLRGISPGTKVVISAGLTTYATSAVIDYMTNSAGVREVMRRLGTLERQTLPEFFQAVIRTEIVKGEPAGSSLVMVRAIQPDKAINGS